MPYAREEDRRAGRRRWYQRNRERITEKKRIPGNPPRKPPVPKACVHCGRKFKGYPSAMRKFCSPKCCADSRRKLPSATCRRCGKDFQPSSHRRRTYCSKECQFSYLKGERHPLWRGNRRHERGSSWWKQSKAARERDKGCTALGCAVTEETAGQKLSVDHIVPFRLTVEYGERNGLDPNHLDNLACLCRSHHSMKTRMEAKLLKGDMVGFLSDIRRLLPLERVAAAFSLWGLNTNIVMMHGKGMKAPELPQ